MFNYNRKPLRTPADVRVAPGIVAPPAFVAFGRLRAFVCDDVWFAGARAPAWSARPGWCAQLALMGGRMLTFTRNRLVGS
jgi:hypothetical protein